VSGQFNMSTAAKKHNLKIASTRNEAGVRVYHAEC
jgi:hypothetical protein